MTFRIGRAWSFVALVCFWAFQARPAQAQASASTSAAAEALFEDAVRLMENKEHAKACEKFRASQEMDPALGTLLRLADCFDRIDKTASAWATFKEVSSLAAQQGQTERQRVADERVADLEARLSRVELRVAAKNQIKGLEIMLNGVRVPSATWNSSLPVDPGPQRVSASAPGRKPWQGSIDVPKGPSEVSLDVPALAQAPKRAQEDAKAPEAPSSGSTQRVIGYVVGGVGVAGLAASGVLAYRAHSLREQSLDQCQVEDSNACTAAGVELRRDAVSYARAANYPFFAGAALLAGGVALVLTAPSGASNRASSSRLTATVDPLSEHVTVRVEAAW
jgi:hypothetical protein